MKAWTYTKAGSPLENLQLSTDHPVPSPSTLSPTDLLIKVSHSSINPTMRLIMSAYPTILLQKTPPQVAEFEFSGVVVALSANADAALCAEFPPGTPVLGMNDPVLDVIRKNRGSLAEYVVATTENLIRKPENVSFEEAAGIAATGCTALNLVTRAGVKSGDKVLINGGSSGTGLMAVQLVKDILGDTGKVVAVCSGSSEELVKSVGADEVRMFRKVENRGCICISCREMDVVMYYMFLLISANRPSTTPSTTLYTFTSQPATLPPPSTSSSTQSASNPSTTIAPPTSPAPPATARRHSSTSGYSTHPQPLSASAVRPYRS